MSSARVAEMVPMGLCAVEEQMLMDFVASEAQLHDRTDALENDPTLQQLVAYVLVECGGRLLMYQRAPKGSGDKRIQGKFSIAFGGHVNSEDAKPGVNPVVAGRAREVAEEVALSHAPRYTFVGTLNINRAPIDLFHLGCVYKAQVDSPNYQLNEPQSFQWSAWSTPEEVAAKFDHLESWSQEVFRTLYPQNVSSRMTAGV